MSSNPFEQALLVALRQMARLTMDRVAYQTLEARLATLPTDAIIRQFPALNGYVQTYLIDIEAHWSDFGAEGDLILDGHPGLMDNFLDDAAASAWMAEIDPSFREFDGEIEPHRPWRAA